MENLDGDWFIKPPIDFEIKKYILLGWLMKISNEMKNIRIFPSLSFLESNIEILDSIYQKINTINEKVLLNKFDMNNDNIKEVYDIIEFSIPLMREKINQMEKLKLYCYDAIKIEKIRINKSSMERGIVVLYSEEGFPTNIFSWKPSILTSDNPSTISIMEYNEASNITDKKKLKMMEESIISNNMSYVKCYNPNSLPLENTFKQLLADKISTRIEIIRSS